MPYVTYATSSPVVAFEDVCAMTGGVHFSPMGGAGNFIGYVPTPTSPLPADFHVRFYGAEPSLPYSFTVSSSGWMSLGTVSSDLFSASIPGPVNNLIAPLWISGLQIRSSTLGGAMCYALTGTAPNRHLVVQWEGATTGVFSDMSLSFEVVIHEAIGTNDSLIDVVYRNAGMSTSTGTPLLHPSMVVAGVQNVDGSLFTVDMFTTTAHATEYTPSTH
jgi:hypothetical protein